MKGVILVALACVYLSLVSTIWAADQQLISYCQHLRNSCEAAKSQAAMKKAHNYINYPADLHEIRDGEKAEQEANRICAEKDAVCARTGL